MNAPPVYPPDPACKKCHGTGFLWEHGGKEPCAWASFGNCDCRSYTNVGKARAACRHEFVCPKCGQPHGEESSQEARHDG